MLCARACPASLTTVWLIPVTLLQGCVGSSQVDRQCAWQPSLQGLNRKPSCFAVASIDMVPVGIMILCLSVHGEASHKASWMVLQRAQSLSGSLSL